MSKDYFEKTNNDGTNLLIQLLKALLSGLVKISGFVFSKNLGEDKYTLTMQIRTERKKK